MTRDEWLAFLDSPVRPGILATVRADGRPHAAPVWYALDGDTVLFNTSASSLKGRTIARDPRVTLVVQDDRPPFSYVAVSGVAELSDDLDDVRLWAGRIGGRYMGEDRAEEFGDRNGVAGELLVRVPITHVVAYKDVAD
jgi:PPOX class probable F420-dependent enzyme